MKIKSFLSLIGMTVLLSLNANASIDFTYLNPAYADGSGRIAVTYPTNYVGGETSESGIWVGQLQMRNPATGQQFTTFCLSPEGGLSPGTAAYNPISLEAAKYGSEPSTWSKTGGIENASYLWGMENSLVSNSDQGAALNLAVWTALYNSTALGAVTDSGRFSVSGSGFTPEIAADYENYLSLINSAGTAAIQTAYASGEEYILRPVDSSMQDLLVLRSDLPPETANAPEPSTIFGIGFLGLMILGGTVKEKMKLPRFARAA